MAIRDSGKLQRSIMDVTTPGTVLGNEAAKSSDETLSTASEPVAKAAPPRKKAKRVTKHSAKPKKAKVRTYMRRKVGIMLMAVVFAPITLTVLAAVQRLITMLQSGAYLEANSVAFSAYHPTGLPGDEGTELGLLISDTVDEDDLFPYQPAECLQQDMTMIMMLEWRRNDEGFPIVVLSRWWCLRIRQSNIYISPTEVERIRSGVDKVAEAMLLTVKHAAAVSR